MNPTDTQAVVIRDAIVRISAVAPTNARGLLEAFLPCLSPTRAAQGDSALPCVVIQHGGNPERAATRFYLPYSQLCFHIGNAILEYYACVLKPIRKIDVLQKRTALLCDVADKGMPAFTISGDYTHGFYLQEKADAEKERLTAAADPAGEGSTGSPKQVH